MAVAVLTTTWCCNKQMEVVAIPWGIDVGGWGEVIVGGEVVKREGGDVEEVGAVWSTLWYAC